MTGTTSINPHNTNEGEGLPDSFLHGHIYPIFYDSKKGVTRVLHKKAFFKKILSLALIFISAFLGCKKGGSI